MIDLAETKPEFLALLDSDPDRAKSEFYEFATYFFRTRPPKSILALPVEIREDIIQDVCLRFITGDCKALHDYSDHGKPFAAILIVAANNAAIDWRKKMANREKSIPPIMPETGMMEPKPIWLDAKRIVDKCLRAMARQEDRVILKKHAEGYTPEEIKEVLYPKLEEVRPTIYVQIETALRRLRKCIEQQGVRFEDLV